MAIGATLAAIGSAVSDAAAAAGTAIASTAADVGTAVASSVADIGATAGAAGATDIGTGLTAADLAGGTGLTTAAASSGGFLSSVIPSSTAGWLSLASVGSSLAGGFTAAAGAQQSAQAQSAAARYNAEVAAQNSQQALNNAQIAIQAGNAQTSIESQRSRAAIGNIIAGQAAGGVDVLSGSNLDIRLSQESLDQMNVLNVASNAARQAYGYETQATGYQAESKLGLSEAEWSKAAGDIAAGSTILGATGNAASNYARYLQNSGMTF